MQPCCEKRFSLSSCGPPNPHRFSSPCLSRWGRLGRHPTFLPPQNAASPRLACNCRTPSEFAPPSIIHAFNSGGRSDKCRHSFFTGLEGNKGAVVAVQEEVQQSALSSDVMSTTSGDSLAMPSDVWPSPICTCHGAVRIVVSPPVLDRTRCNHAESPSRKPLRI